MKSLKLISFAILIFYIMAGNDPAPSSGCGKDLNLPKTGSFEFSWSQGKRTVRIDIPDNYDNTKPYKLMFGMHCMGGWAGGVQQEGYYGLKPFDTAKNFIFVAPEGNGNKKSIGEKLSYFIPKLFGHLKIA